MRLRRDDAARDSGGTAELQSVGAAQRPAPSSFSPSALARIPLAVSSNCRSSLTPFGHWARTLRCSPVHTVPTERSNGDRPCWTVGTCDLPGPPLRFAASISPAIRRFWGLRAFLTESLLGKDGLLLNRLCLVSPIVVSSCFGALMIESIV